MKPRSQMFFSLVLVLLLSFLTKGCVIGHYYEGPKITEERIDSIKPGITTKAEIVEWFGPPQNYVNPTVINKILAEFDVTREPLTTYPFANILVYQYNEGRIKALILILFNHAEFNVKSDHLVIFLDDNERVKYFGYRKGTEEFKLQ